MAVLVINNSQNSITEVRHDTVLTVNPSKSRVLQVSSEISIAEILKTEVVTAYSEVERSIEILHETVVEILNHPEPTTLEICHAPPSVPSGEQPQINVIVPSGETRVIDEVNALLAKWIVFGEDRLSGKKMGFEVLSSLGGGDVEHSIFGILGDKLAFSDEVILSGQNLVFSITNHGANDLYFSLKRTALRAW